MAFILYVDHFYKNTESNTAESAHPVVKKDSEQPKQEQKEVEVDITTIIKKISVPLPEGIFATLRGRSLYLSPDAQITEPRAVMAFVAYEIWYENAGNSRFDPSMKDMEQTLKDAKSDQNRAFHREEWVRKGISEEQYWQEFETQVEKELRTWKYLHHMIGEPSEVGGAEFKKAMNDFIVKTFINHQTVIQINENMISF
ncbi:hypothetical protein [Bacillus sp. UNCCL13]|uniref:hypothetical protein n=1 Tax=Bacillus sp. UNCCL13 TaxID=1502772 RepID=UPI000B87E73C|nr:hypothetical protein [Bacillus sp. UNCCL13]